MIIRYLLIISSLLVFLNQNLAQSNLSEEKVKELTLLGSQIEGTFQIQMLNTRSKPTFELSLYEIINEKRKIDENVYHNVNPKMRILILSKNIIDAENFKTIDRVKYISTTN